jgi:hypothetical protein
MARNSIIRENPPGVPDPTPDETPHGCYRCWVFLGYEDEDGHEHHEAVPCRRCAEHV